MTQTRMKSVLLGLSLVTLAGCSDSKPDTEVQKQSYAAGVRLAETFHKHSVKIDHGMVEMAIRDVVSGAKLKMSEQDLKTAQLRLAEEVDKARFQQAGSNLKETEKKIDDYVKQPGVKRTDSGLAYKIIKTAKGPRPKDSDTVIVDYTGKLTDGLIFDSSVQRGKPAEFQLANIIPGLKEALKLMTVGSQIEVMIPPQLGYGASGNANIPSNSALIFELDLKGIKAQ